MSPEIKRALFPKTLSWRIARLIRKSTAVADGILVFTNTYLSTFRAVLGTDAPKRKEPKNEL